MSIEYNYIYWSEIWVKIYCYELIVITFLSLPQKSNKKSLAKTACACFRDSQYKVIFPAFHKKIV